MAPLERFHRWVQSPHPQGRRVARQNDCGAPGGAASPAPGPPPWSDPPSSSPLPVPSHLQSLAGYAFSVTLIAVQEGNPWVGSKLTGRLACPARPAAPPPGACAVPWVLSLYGSAPIDTGRGLSCHGCGPLFLWGASAVLVYLLFKTSTPWDQPCLGGSPCSGSSLTMPVSSPLA